MSNPYLYQGTSVLINKPGFKDQDKLSAYEREMSAGRARELMQNPIRGQFDLAHMQAIHGHVFQDVYDWAGQLRVTNITKGAEGDKTIFTRVADLQKAGADIANNVKKLNFLRGMESKEFAGKMAELYKQVNDLHPSFREGNGRTTREYFRLLANGAGYHINYDAVTKQEWNNAAKLSARGDLAPMTAVFQQITVPQRAVAFDQLDWATAVSKHPELDGAIKTLSDAHDAGLNTAKIKADLSKVLHEGRIVAGNVSPKESQHVMEWAAALRGLSVQAPGALGTKHAGVIVAESTHHLLMQIGEGKAVQFERKDLDKSLNLKVGDSLTLQHQEAGRSMSREVSGGSERERSPSPR